MAKKKKRKAIESMSFTAPIEQKDEIINMAEDYGTNRSWMLRFLLKYSVTHLTHNQIFSAVEKDPDSKRRVIK